MLETMLSQLQMLQQRCFTAWVRTCCADVHHTRVGQAALQLNDSLHSSSSSSSRSMGIEALT
jgi:hypothetical protein